MGRSRSIKYIDAETEHPFEEDSPVYLMGHEGCALLRTPGNRSDGDCGTLQLTTEQIERKT